MNGEIKFGIMGPGRIAHKFAEALRDTDGVVLRAAASKSLEKAREFSLKYGAPEYYDSYEEMCRKSDIDAVYIATTNNYHYENIMTCLKYGKHVVCEKPILMTRNEMEAVLEKASEKGVFLMEALWTRFLPSYMEARKMVFDGVIGDVKMIENSLIIDAPFDPAGRLFNKQLGGGASYDLGVYSAGMASFFTKGVPEFVEGTVEMSSTGVDQSGALLMRFSDGAAAMMKYSFVYGGDCEMTIYGTKGRIVFPGKFHGSDRFELILKDGSRRVVEHKFDNGFVFELREAARCIQAGLKESPVMPWRDSLMLAGVYDKMLSV